MKKQDIDILMSYLYGELDASQKQELEVRLTQDAALRAELEQLQQTRGWLKTASADVVKAPPLIISQAVSQPSIARQWLGSRWLHIAAAVALLLFAGRMSGLQMKSHEGQLMIAFGEVKTLPAVEPQDNAWQQTLMAHQVDLEAEICALTESLLSPQETKLSPVQLNRIRKSLLAETNRSFQQFFQTAKKEQTAQTNLFLEQFALLVQQQREQDLEAIEFALNDLFEQTEYQQSETDIILTEIIDRLEEGR